MPSLFRQDFLSPLKVLVTMTGDHQPPVHRAAKWDPATKQMESIVLATVHMWTLCQPKTEAVPLILRHFVAADVHVAMCELALSVEAEKTGTHRTTSGRSASELYADEL